MSLKRAARLGAKKHREAERLFLAEGAVLLSEAPVAPHRLFEERAEIRRLSTLTTPAGPVGVFSMVDVPAEELLAGCDRVVFLHGVQDPGNVGTVIRSAHAFGAGVALSRGCADLYNPKTVRATMGSIFHAPVARELVCLEFLSAARRRGFATVAAVAAGGGSPRDMPGGRVMMVVGSEGRGLPEEVEAACGVRTTIPSRAASLNAAVAASVLLYEAFLPVLP